MESDGAAGFQSMIDDYLRQWNLVPDGGMWVTHTAALVPVLRGGRKAMLKVCREAEERRGNALMAWWDGAGAAPVLACDGTAILLARAAGPATLAGMARCGRDDEACRILCATAARLHASRSKPPPDLMPLERWFRELPPAAAAHGGILVQCAGTARELLADPCEVGILHGDLHHGNVLDFGQQGSGAGGWLAIDPKGLLGERGFDYAALFLNPDLADPAHPVAVDPGRFARRVEVVAAAAGLGRTRLLHWILAGAGLSAAWFLDDGESAAISLRIAELAAAELVR